MWLAVGLDSVAELSDPTVHDYPVAGWVPLLVVGTGLVATSVAARKRRDDLLGLSLAAATTGGLLALWRDFTWGSVMW